MVSGTLDFSSYPLFFWSFGGSPSSLSYLDAKDLRVKPPFKPSVTQLMQKDVAFISPVLESLNEFVRRLSRSDFSTALEVVVVSQQSSDLGDL